MTAKKILDKVKKGEKKRLFIKLFIGGFFSFILIFTLSNTRFLSKGISLEINGVEDGGVYNENVLNIDGNAKRSKHLTVNGREVTINQSGEFTDTLVLLPGYNIISISAEDKFGKKTEEIFEVIKNI
jgi:hypothetical protein